MQGVYPYVTNSTIREDILAKNGEKRKRHDHLLTRAFNFPPPAHGCIPRLGQLARGITEQCSTRTDNSKASTSHGAYQPTGTYIFDANMRAPPLIWL